MNPCLERGQSIWELNAGPESDRSWPMSVNPALKTTCRRPGLEPASFLAEGVCPALTLNACAPTTSERLDFTQANHRGVTGSGHRERPVGSTQLERFLQRTTIDEPICKSGREAVASADPVEDLQPFSMGGLDEPRVWGPSDGAPVVDRSRSHRAQRGRDDLEVRIGGSDLVDHGREGVDLEVLEVVANANPGWRCPGVAVSGVAGFEPTASSSRTWFEHRLGLRREAKPLVAGLVTVVLLRSPLLPVTRSTPSSLPMIANRVGPTPICTDPALAEGLQQRALPPATSPAGGECGVVDTASGVVSAA